MPAPLLPIVEPLEARIAPAAILNPRTVSYTDVDGDAVLVKFSVPLFTSAAATENILNGLTVGSTARESLDTINLLGLTAAQGMNISVTVLPRLGEVAIGGNTVVPDGRVNVGAIIAADVQPEIFSVLNGIDLGVVRIEGDLGGIEVGDPFATPAIAKLEVDSFGAQNTGGITTSTVLGPIGTLLVHGDFAAASLRVIGAGFGVINKLQIEGNLDGSTLDGVFDGNGNPVDGTRAASIVFSGHLGSVKLGGIVGGEDTQGGLIFGTGNGGRIGSLTVLGDITGGGGNQSAFVQARAIGKVRVAGDLVGGSGPNSGVFSFTKSAGDVAIAGDLTGGTGANSGRFTANGGVRTFSLGGDLEGGSQTNSGTVFAKTIGKVNIDGSILGGGGAQSGRLSTNGVSASVAIGGDITGAGGTLSGSIAILTARTLSVGGSVQGGAGVDSGFVSFSGGNVEKLTIGEDIAGGAGNGSGRVRVVGTLQNAEIGGDIIGGTVRADFEGNGQLRAQRLGSVSVENLIAGDFATAPGTPAAQTQILIHADTEFDALEVRNDITGNANVMAGVSATSQVGPKGETNVALHRVSILGDMTRGEILAGYGVGVTNNGRGSIFDADAQIGTVTIEGALSASSIVAGVGPGADGYFGTADDTQTGFGVNSDARISQIASVIVKGAATGDAVANTNYAITAAWVKSVSVAGTAVALTAERMNDLFPGVALGASGDFAVIERVDPLAPAS